MLHAERLTCIVDDRPLFAALTLSSLPASCCRSPVITARGKPRCCGSSAAGAPGKRVVSWQGQPLAKVRESFHRQLLWLGHKPGVNAALTADENLRFFFPASRLQQRESALAAVGGGL